MEKALKVLLTLAPPIVDILKAAARSHYRSAYIASMIVEHDRLWREALTFLRSHGWSVDDIRDAAKALAKMPPSFSREVYAKELEETGYEHFASIVRESCDTAAALSALVAEWRLGNEALKSRVSSD